MRKSSIFVNTISIILILTFIASQAFGGQLSLNPSNDTLAASYVSDPNINSYRSDAIKSDIAGDVKPGAVGNGMLLVNLLKGVMPPKLSLAPEQREDIEKKLRSAIRLAMQLYTVHSNDFTDGSLKDIARRTSQNLVSFNNALSRELYPFNASIEGKENYLIGFGLDEFNREEKAALAVDFINWLYLKYTDEPQTALLRLAQYVFHERTPERTIIKEELGKEPEINRDDHRRIYTRVQSVIFGQAEVDALKRDLREFINDRAMNEFLDMSAQTPGRAEFINQPLTIGRGQGAINVPNRRLAQPMERNDSPGGHASKLTLDSYARVSKLAYGIVSIEAASIGESRARFNQLRIGPGYERDIEKLVKVIRDNSPFGEGQIISIQPNHAGSICDSRFSEMIRTYEPKTGDKDSIPGKLLMDEDVEPIIEAYVQAAVIAYNAGVNIVDFKCCHGYLLGQFLRPANMSRENWSYGGSLANRIRIVQEIIRRTKERIKDKKFKVMVRISLFEGDDIRGGIGAKGPDSTELDLSEPLKMIESFVAEGADMVNVSAGIPKFNGATWVRSVTREGAIKKPGNILSYHHILFAKSVKDALRRAGREDVVVIGSGYSALKDDADKVANAALERGYLDIVGFGRKTLAGNRKCALCSGCSRRLMASAVGCVMHNPFYRLLDNARNRAKTGAKDGRFEEAVGKIESDIADLPQFNDDMEDIIRYSRTFLHREIMGGYLDALIELIDSPGEGNIASKIEVFLDAGTTVFDNRKAHNADFSGFSLMLESLKGNLDVANPAQAVKRLAGEYQKLVADPQFSPDTVTSEQVTTIKTESFTITVPTADRRTKIGLLNRPIGTLPDSFLANVRVDMRVLNKPDGADWGEHRGAWEAKKKFGDGMEPGRGYNTDNPLRARFIKKLDRRIIPAVPTPTDEDGNILWDKLRAYARSIAREDIAGVAMSVHTGRGPHRTLEEWIQVYRLWREELGPDKMIIAGANSVGMAHLAKIVGADAILVFPPKDFINDANRARKVLEYHNAIAEVSVPMVLFDLTKEAGGMGYTKTELEALGQIRQVVAIKSALWIDIVANQDKAELMAKRFRDIVLITGEDRFWPGSVQIAAGRNLIDNGIRAPVASLLGMSAAFPELEAELMWIHDPREKDPQLIIRERDLNYLIDAKGRATFFLWDFMDSEHFTMETYVQAVTYLIARQYLNMSPAEARAFSYDMGADEKWYDWHFNNSLGRHVPGRFSVGPKKAPLLAMRHFEVLENYFQSAKEFNETGRIPERPLLGTKASSISDRPAAPTAHEQTPVVLLSQIYADLPVRAEVFAANLKKILADHPDQLFFIGVENDIGESQKAQIMPLYKAIDEIKELKDASGKPLFPNLMVRRGKAEELVSIMTELSRAENTRHNGIEFGTLDLNRAFIGARKLSVDRNLYDSVKGEGRAWISAIDDSRPGDYLPVFEAITVNMMAYLNADLTAIKNFYDAIADKPIDPIALKDMIRNRLIYILPRATKFDTKQLRKLYELAQQVYVAA